MNLGFVGIADISEGDVHFTPYADRLRIGVGGTLTFEPVLGDSLVTLENVSNGEYISFAVKRIVASDTTCANIVYTLPPTVLAVMLNYADILVIYGEQDVSYSIPT